MNKVLTILILFIMGFYFFITFDLNYKEEIFPVSHYYQTKGKSETGAANIVTAIYLNYRVYDTLGEATIFFGTCLGVFILLKREKKRKKRSWNIFPKS